MVDTFRGIVYGSILRAVVVAAVSFLAVFLSVCFLYWVTQTVGPGEAATVCREPCVPELAEAIAVLLIIGSVSAAAWSAMMIARRWLGSLLIWAALVGTHLAIAASIAGLAQPGHVLGMMGWRWQIDVALVWMLGAALGVVATAGRQGVKAGWLPVAAIASATLLLWSVYGPAAGWLVRMWY